MLTGRFFPPNFRNARQHKSAETYAPRWCEQVVGNFALKQFFGSQLLRARPVLWRRQIVLSHVGCALPRGTRCNILVYRLAINGL